MENVEKIKTKADFIKVLKSLRQAPTKGKINEKYIYYKNKENLCLLNVEFFDNGKRQAFFCTTKHKERSLYINDIDFLNNEEIYLVAKKFIERF